MYSSGRIPLICVTVFALVMTGLLVGATDVLAEGRSVETLSFYTSFGRNTTAPEYMGGPYIIGAVWDPSGDGGNGEIRVIFNEPLLEGSIENPDPTPGPAAANYDFKPHGFAWSGTGAMPAEAVLLDIPAGAGRVVALRGFSAGNPPAAGDSISLRRLFDFVTVDYPDSAFTVLDWTGGVQSADPGNPASLDHTVIPLTTGPHIVSATLSDDWHTVPLGATELENLTITLEFDQDVVVPTPATPAESLLFKLAPEILQIGGEEVDIVIAAGTNPNMLDITWDNTLPGGSNGYWRWMMPGISQYVLGAGAVASDATTGNPTNSIQQRVMLDNAGPVLIGATLETNAANTMWLIFNEPVDPASFLTVNPNTQYTITDGGGGADWGALPVQQSGFGTEFTNVIKVESAYNDPANWNAADAIDADLGDGPTDFQLLGVIDADAVPIGNGITMVRASYDAKGTADNSDDELVVVFSEGFAVVPDLRTDFELVPDDYDGIFAVGGLEYVAAPVVGETIVRITNFDDPQVEAILGTDARLPVGMGISLTPAAAVRGTRANGSPYDDLVLPVCEDLTIWPTDVGDDISSSKFYNDPDGIAHNGDEVDIIYLTWQEDDTDPSANTFNPTDEWLVYFAKATATNPDPLEDIFNNTAYRTNGIPLGDFKPQAYNGLGRYLKAHFSVRHGTPASDGTVLADGDTIKVALLPATIRGSVAPYSRAITFGGISFIVGPPCTPVDFDATDDDLVHVRATLISPETGFRQYKIWGDPGAAPCGDTILVGSGLAPYDWTAAPPVGSLLAAGPINTADGSFDTLTVTFEDPFDPLSRVYLRSSQLGALSTDSLLILVDTAGPTLWTVNDSLRNPDRFDPYRIYTANDYVNILLKAHDGGIDRGTGLAVPGALSGLLTVSADFSEVNEAAGSDAVPLRSMGADQIDNDGDWVDEAADGNDGPGADNGDVDVPEPFVDEDGSGGYNPGETFYDRDGDGLCDCRGGSGDVWDANLDSDDPDEHGWYEIRLNTAASDTTNVSETTIRKSKYFKPLKGYPLTDPVTDPEGGVNFAEMLHLPVSISVSDALLDTLSAYDDEPAGALPVPFYCEVDEAPPSVTLITFVAGAADSTYLPAEAENLYRPTNPTYNLGRFVYLEAEMQSDEDVLYGIIQLSKDGGSTWFDLLEDPAGQNNGAENNYPGLPGIDDDHDGLADSADVEVAAAIATPEADGRDNDGDAYFTFEPYHDHGATTLHRIIWHNIDEAGETYASANPLLDVLRKDENEDGLDGEAVAINFDNAAGYVQWDSGGAAGSGTIYVDAATILGRAGATASEADTLVDRYNGINHLTEFLGRSYAVLDSAFTPPWGAPPDTVFGDATTYGGNHVLSRLNLRGANIDFRYLLQYYGLVADGVTPYKLRVKTYDNAGLTAPEYSVPMTFTLDLIAPNSIHITDCWDNTAADPAGPADFDLVDVRPDRDWIQIYEDSGTYTVTVDSVAADVDSVFFEWRYSLDEGVTWIPPEVGTTPVWQTLIPADGTEPFTYEFDSGLIPLSQTPADEYALVEMRVYARDTQGNFTDRDDEDRCVWRFEIIDGTAPTVWFTMLWNEPNLWIGDPLHTPPVYFYRDSLGPVQVPRGDIPIWADYDGVIDADVIRVVFEYRPVGSGGEWTAFKTRTGNVLPDGTIDLTKPVMVTLATDSLDTGTYDIRVYACDIEGNCNIETADMATIMVVEGGLRAYIEDPIGTGTTRTLYAFNYLHDVSVDYVTFQYSQNSGTTWTDIGVAGGTDNTRGDVLVLRGTLTSYEDLTGLADPDTVFAADEMYWDIDDDGIYTPRDPIIWDQNTDGLFVAVDDSVLLGDGGEIPDSTALSAFAAGLYHTDDVEDDNQYDAGEWIFQDNAMEPAPPDEQLDLWTLDWNVEGLGGTFWVRAVATDEFFATDNDSVSPIPHVVYEIDTTEPVVEITRLRYMLGSTVETLIPGTDVLEIPGAAKWIEITADAPGSEEVLFEYNTGVGGDVSIDLNDDNDFFADIVSNGVFDHGDEEIFLDINGDFHYDAGDLCLSMGDNDVIDTPVGTALLPLIGEDPAGNGDEDGDEWEDEDDVTDPLDRDEPYIVFFQGHSSFLSDTAVKFLATAWDAANNSGADSVSVLIGEAEAPITDIHTVTTAAGTEVDFKQPLIDGDPVDVLGGLESDLMLEIFATSPQPAGIASMDLMWRWHPDCYPDLDPWLNNWASMSAAGWTTLDMAYPDWRWTLDLEEMIADVGDGTFEFYAMATDGNGNQTAPYAGRYALRVITSRAHISTTAWLDPAVVDQQVWLQATLRPADVRGTGTVYFLGAQRVIEEELDLARVTPSWPYQTLPLEGALYVDAELDAGDHVVLVDVAAPTAVFTFHEDEAALQALAAPTKYDWTFNGTGITFGVRPEPTDNFLISYNTTDYLTIGVDNTAHNDSLYTAMWTVTAPVAPATAFDVIAQVVFGNVGDPTCYTSEPLATEGWLLHVVEQFGPTVFIYMGGAGALEPDNAAWPGNSSFYTQDQIGQQGTLEWKLSGLEGEVFVRENLRGPLESATLLLTDPTGAVHEVPLREITTEQDTVHMAFTVYESDWPEVDYGFENVTLNLGGETYAMSRHTTDYRPYWQVVAPVPVNATTVYDFSIDVNGNNFGTFADPRNSAAGVSNIAVPATPFFAATLDLEELLGTTTGVCQLSAQATNASAEVGIYPPVLFVYDPEKPVINPGDLFATHDRFGETVPVTLYARITDPNSFNAVTIDSVLFQYCPNYMNPNTGEWDWRPIVSGSLTNGYDSDPSDGWAAEAFTIPDPENDNLDNDGNGLVDEAAEAMVTMAWRVFAVDDGHNYSAASVLEFILDSVEPEAELIQPENGAVFAYDATITLEAEITETQADINHVTFQFDVGSGWPTWDYGTGPGQSKEGYVDPTPEDSRDHPWVMAADTTATGTYKVTFYIPDYREWIEEHDTYIRFRAVAVDNAENEDANPPEVLVLINDITSPTAWITGVQSTGRPDFMSIMDPHVAIQGEGVHLAGTVADPESLAHIATVEIQYYHATAGWTVIEVLQPADLTAMLGDIRMGTFADTLLAGWDVRELEAQAAQYASGVRVRAVPTDSDGNRYVPAAEDEILLMLDTTDPNVLYAPIAGHYDGLTTFEQYDNNGLDDPELWNVLKPNEYSQDLYFTVVSTSNDLESVTLQWRYHTDGIGAWRAWPGGGALDYEPNLNFTPTGGQLHYVWRLRVPNFVDTWLAAGLGGGRCDIRGLAMDYAGRANILHDANNDWDQWTIDVTNPKIPNVTEWADNLPDHQVIAGGVVHLQVELRDAVPDSANTDIAAAYFEYKREGSDTWLLIEDPAGVQLTGNRIDTPFAFWLAEVDWTTPTEVYWDEVDSVRVTYWDAAGNTPGPQVWATAITVEDEIEPDLSKITLIPAEVEFVDVLGGTAGAPDFDCDAGAQDAFFIDVDENGQYDLGVDVPVDFGQADTVLADSALANGAVGDSTNTWPRWINEIEINGTNELIVSNDVTLVGRTQDPDVGLEYVEFWAQKLDNTGQAVGAPILIGVDDCVPNWTDLRTAGLGPLWHVVWHTETDLGQTGSQRFPDGWYDIYVRAMDREGNYELLNADTEMARVYVDNTAPTSRADADPTTAGIQTGPLVVERNEFMTMYAETDNSREDDIITFYWKRARDLNLEPSYTWPEHDPLISEGVDASDVNPDPNRPYSYDWDLDKANPALVVGETYEMVTAVEDIVGNRTDQMTQWDYGRMTFTVQDTKAPVATITRIARVTGNTTAIPLPADMEVVHARDLAYIEAKLLGLDRDCIQVDFMYAEDGSTTPVLIDGVLNPDSTGLVWTLMPAWDLRTLAGKTLWVFAVGRDDVGNVDFDETTGRPVVSEPFKLYVDYEPPVLAVVEPVDGQKKCPFLGAGADSVYLLQFGLDESYTQYDIWHNQVLWQWKLSTEPAYAPGDAVPWNPTGVFDSETGVWTNYWDLAALTPATGLYDFQLTVFDDAGNSFVGTVAEKVVVDGIIPDVANISRLVVNGEDIYTTPQPVDITAGDIITLVATVSDQEAALPDEYETGVAEVLFQVGWPDPAGVAWRTIGEWMPPAGTLFIEGTAQMDWNTTGLDLGEDGETVLARVVVRDEVCNVREGATWTLQINDNIPARARIAGWYPCVIPHGDERAAYVRIYAVAYSDTTIDEVQFQYHEAGSTQWIPIGIGQGETTGIPSGVDYLWYTDIDLKDSNFAVGDQITLRAIATDNEGNLDEAPPEVTVIVHEYEEGLWAGMWDFMPQTYADPLLTGPEVMLIPGQGDQLEAKVHVMLSDPMQEPHVLLIWPDDPAGGDAVCSDANNVEMLREITPGTEGSWYGWEAYNGAPCGRHEVFATAMTTDGNLQIYRTDFWSYEVTDELGTNGWATVTGYVTALNDTTTVRNEAKVNVPTGAGGMAQCLYLGPVDPPLVNGDQERYMTMVPRTAYFIGYPGYAMNFNDGFYPYVTIEYDDAALLDVFGTAESAAAREPFLTVKVWGDADETAAADKIWHSLPISDVSVNTAENEVTFRVDSFDADAADTSQTMPYFALFAPSATAPVTVSSFTPGSVRYGRWNYTDADPVIVAYLNCPGPARVREQSIELWIDDVLWAATASQWNWWARGSGVFEWMRANEDGTIYQIAYRHSYRMEDWLTPGWHTLNIVFEDDTDQGNWYELPAEAAGARFFVDTTPPNITFHGGFVSSPVLKNIAGYVSTATTQNMLKVELYDGESGIYMRPDHPEWMWDANCDDNLPPDPRHAMWQDDAVQVWGAPYTGDPNEDGCWFEVDYGFKYDLWLVEHGQGEDEQGDIDEIEERLLLHPGTADEVLPYCNPPFYAGSVPGEASAENYTPEDVLTVGLPIMGGGLIKDGDILEVVIYSYKTIEEFDDGLYVGATLDTMVIGGQQIVVYANAFVDMRSQEMHLYHFGLIDYARNMGSRYVEQRFVVDKSGPTARLVGLPPVPGEAATICVAIDDRGAGVATSGADAPVIQLIGPDGGVVEGVEFAYANGQWCATVEDGLEYGHYSVVVNGSDLAGNHAIVTLPLVAQEATLSVREGFIYPNPVNPNDNDAVIHLMLGRDAHVTAKVYDFAGDYVTTIASGAYSAGEVAIPWDGTANGAELGNGAYLIRVEAEDGNSKKGATIKAVIWREE